MENLNAQVVLALVLAVFVGAGIGWWLKSLSTRKLIAGLEEGARQRAASVGSGVKVAATAGAADKPVIAGGHPIEDIEGIGKGFGARLRAMDISTVEELLAKCKTRDSQVATARRMDLEDFVVHKWVCVADLMRVPGVGSQFAELLEASGVRSVQQLGEQNPKALVARMVETNARESRTHPIPSLDNVVSWIDKAKSLPVVLEEKP